MPITPHFTLSQTNTHIVIDISVPHVRVNVESMHLALSEQNRRLHWSCLPYLLVLQFQQAFDETAAEQAEDEAASAATYHPTIQHGMLRLSLAKAEPGVEWRDLDLIGKLMPAKHDSTRQATSQWIQQVVDTSTTRTNGDGKDYEAEFAADQATSSTCWVYSSDGYGFLRMYQGVFGDWTRDGLAKEMFESPWPDDGEENVLVRQTQPASLNIGSETGDIDKILRLRRRQERQIAEQESFDEDRYFQDMECQDDYLYMMAMSMQPHWSEILPSASHASDDENSLPNRLQQLSLSNEDQAQPSSVSLYFTQDESAQLASIPYPLLPPSKLIDSTLQDGLLLGLLDILFAYVYDHLMTCDDPTVESAWNISILSASFSWLEDWIDDVQQQDSNENRNDEVAKTLDSIIVSSTRRSLVYPYLRSLQFSVHVWQQVGHIITRGRRCVIRCLLQVREILHQSELYYLNNKLFVDPYLAWLQQESDCDELDRRMEEIAKLIEKKVACSVDSLRDRLDLGLAAIENRIWDECLVSEDASVQHQDDENEDGESGSDEDSDGSEDDSGTSDDEVDAFPENEESEKANESLTGAMDRPVEHSSALLDDKLRLTSLAISSTPISGIETKHSSKDGNGRVKGPMIEVIEEEIP